MEKFRTTINEYPRTFWILIGSLFIDRLGGALIFPFFSLYITQKFNVGMTQVGTLFAFYAVSSFIGSMVGGALTDRFGRRSLMIFGLLSSAFSALIMGLSKDFHTFFVFSVIVGMFADMGHPAGQAMITDILPESKRIEGFGILRVVANLAVTIGPAIGGLIASKSFFALFIIDAVASSVTALLVYLTMPETKPERHADQPHESVLQTFKGYSVAIKDGIFMAFLAVSAVSVIVYMQMNTTLSVYLRDVHNITTQQFGYILSLNAAMVVVFQFWVTRKIKKIAPMLLMTFGTLFYLVGFTMYGFTTTYPLFLFAMVIITIGEMIVSPTSTAVVARLAPANMRGRYMAVNGFSWIIPSAIGPLLAGLIMDNYDPRWVWYASGILAAVATFGFFLLHRGASSRLQHTDAVENPPEPILSN
jgi:MFS family permease